MHSSFKALKTCELCLFGIYFRIIMALARETLQKFSIPFHLVQFSGTAYVWLWLGRERRQLKLFL